MAADIFVSCGVKFALFFNMFKKLLYLSQCGYSLVELIVTVALIVVLLLFSIPNFKNWQGRIALSGAARELYINLQHAKLAAIKNNTEMAVWFDVSNDRYIVFSEKGDGSWLTVDDNIVFKEVFLGKNKSGVQYGYGAADRKATSSYSPLPDEDDPHGDSGVVSYANNMAVLNSRGTGNAGYVYLQYQLDGSSFAVCSLSTGVVKIKKWQKHKWD